MNLYETIKQRVENTQPYRGTTNRYPLHKRRHNMKCVYMEQEQGETVYRITYGYTYRWVEATKEDYERDEKRFHRRLQHVQDPMTGTWLETGDYDYGRYVTDPRTMGIVRPDNTFEFVCDSFGQSESMFFNRDLPINAVFFTSCRLGGAILQDSWRKPSVRIPLFKGLRVDLNTLKVWDKQDVRVIKHNIDRKLSKPLMETYGDLIKVSGVMFSAMDNDSFIRELNEVLDKLKEQSNYLSKSDLQEEAIKAKQEKNYFESAMLIAYSINAGGLENHYRWWKNGWSNASELSPTKVHQGLVRGLAKEVYKAESPFKQTEYRAGEVYSSSDWGIDVFCNGVRKNVY